MSSFWAQKLSLHNKKFLLNRYSSLFCIKWLEMMHCQLSRWEIALCLAGGLAVMLVMGSVEARAAAGPTAKGQVSVAQVMDMVERARMEASARETVTAYFAGIGETAGFLLAAQGADGRPFVTCSKRIAIDAASMVEALAEAAPDRAQWGQVAATPILVNVIVSLGECR